MSILIVALILIFLVIAFAMRSKNMMIAKKAGEGPGPQVPAETDAESDPTVIVAEPINAPPPQDAPAPEPVGSIGGSLRNLFRG